MVNSSKHLKGPLPQEAEGGGEDLKNLTSEEIEPGPGPEGGPGVGGAAAGASEVGGVLSTLHQGNQEAPITDTEAGALNMHQDHTLLRLHPHPEVLQDLLI